MIIANYKSKADLKKAIGTQLNYIETHPFASEYMSTGTLKVAGPENKYQAEVTLVNDVITGVK